MKNWIRIIQVVLMMALSSTALSAMSVTIEMKGFGTFKDMISEEKLRELDSLTIIGPFGRADFTALKPALAYKGHLKYLNLYQADLEDKTMPDRGVESYNRCFEEIVLPPDLEILEEGAFQNSPLDIRELPETLKEMGDYAFFQSLGLIRLKIPQSCKTIGKEVCLVLKNLD